VAGVDARQVAAEQVTAIGQLRPVGELRLPLPGDFQPLFGPARVQPAF